MAVLAVRGPESRRRFSGTAVVTVSDEMTLPSASAHNRRQLAPGEGIDRDHLPIPTDRDPCRMLLQAPGKALAEANGDPSAAVDRDGASLA